MEPLQIKKRCQIAMAAQKVPGTVLAFLCVLRAFAPLREALMVGSAKSA